MSSTLSITDLHASVKQRSILHGVNLTIHRGEIHAVMGPNGSGKSTLANLLMGKPGITITKGSVTLDDKDLLALSTPERAKQGLFLGFQHPLSIPGVSIRQLLRLATTTTAPHRGKPTLDMKTFQQRLEEAREALGISKELMSRSVNDGFSGGEKKRLETLQCWMLEPSIALMDETDSGLDVDALKTIAQSLHALVQRIQCSVLLITHYQRILHFLRPQFVHVFVGGKIVASGGKELAEKIEQEGYAQYNHGQHPKLKNAH